MSSPTDAAPAARRLPLSVKLGVVAALYFAQGLPYGIFADLTPVFLRDRGVALDDISQLLARLGLAWTLKFLWAPLVDQLGSRKAWIVGAQLLLAASLAALAVLDAAAATPALWLALGALTFLSATQDVAIDAYSIELLDEREYGAANGIRVTAYRMALLAAGGLLVALAGRTGWSAVFWISAAVMAGIAVVTAAMPSPVRPARVARAGDEDAGFLERTLWHPLRTLAVLPGFAATLLFALAFKAGDHALQAMSRPFWVDAGFSLEQIGRIVGVYGMLATIAGALLGGALTTRWGIFRALWALGLVQALSNLAYWVAAERGATLALLHGAVIIEQFTQGLGTAAFLAFLMALCDRRFAAAQYALLSALYGLGRTLVVDPAGTLTQALGYDRYFLLTFAAALPAFALLPWVRRTLAARHDGVEREHTAMGGVYAVVAVIVAGLAFIVVDVVRDVLG